AASVSGVVHRGLHLEFGDSVRSRNGDTRLGCESRSGIFRKIVGVDAVELEIIGGGLGAIHRYVLRVFAEGSRIRDSDHHSGRERENLREVAIGEREGNNLFLIESAS